MKTACTVCGAICEDGRCPMHPRRAKNAPWSKGRDRGAQAKFRKRVLTAAGYQCQAIIDGVRCPITGAQNLEAHHTRPGDDTEGAALCKPPPLGRGHHKAVDSHAR